MASTSFGALWLIRVFLGGILESATSAPQRSRHLCWGENAILVFWACYTILGLGPPVKTKLTKYIPLSGGYLLLLNAPEVTYLEQS